MQSEKIGYDVSVSVTRPDNTDAYTANDVIGDSTSTTAALEFAYIGGSNSGNRSVLITGAELEIDASAVISGETSYRLYLYNVTPPSALADNAAFDIPAGDRASFLGYVDLGTPIDLGSTLYVQTLDINKQVPSETVSIFGYLVTINAYTPTAERVYKVTLHTLSL